MASKKNTTHARVIRSVMEKTGLKQREIASLIQVHPITVGKWRSGVQAIHHKHWGMLLKLNRDLSGKDFVENDFDKDC